VQLTAKLIREETKGRTDRRSWLDRFGVDADQEFITFIGSLKTL